MLTDKHILKYSHDSIIECKSTFNYQFITDNVYI